MRRGSGVDFRGVDARRVIDDELLAGCDVATHEEFENPFGGRRNKLTPRQAKHRRRMLRFKHKQ